MAKHRSAAFVEKFIWWGSVCFYCLKEIRLDEATPDHRTPKSRGGDDSEENIVPACFPCNRLKGNKTEGEFRATSSAFSKAPPLSNGLSRDSRSTDCASFNLDENDPHLTEKLRKEGEGKSWAWANPFPS